MSISIPPPVSASESPLMTPPIERGYTKGSALDAMSNNRQNSIQLPPQQPSTPPPQQPSQHPPVQPSAEPVSSPSPSANPQQPQNPQGPPQAPIPPPQAVYPNDPNVGEFELNPPPGINPATGQPIDGQPQGDLTGGFTREQATRYAHTACKVIQVYLPRIEYNIVRIDVAGAEREVANNNLHPYFIPEFTKMNEFAWNKLAIDDEEISPLKDALRDFIMDQKPSFMNSTNMLLFTAGTFAVSQYLKVAEIKKSNNEVMENAIKHTMAITGRMPNGRPVPPNPEPKASPDSSQMPPGTQQANTPPPDQRPPKPKRNRGKRGAKIGGQQPVAGGAGKRSTVQSISVQ